MILSMIAAMDKNRIIGSDNKMPWHLPDDLKFFKATTLGKTIIMGRKTFESIGSKSLPKRRNLVITRNANFVAKDAEVFSSIEESLKTCQLEEEVVIVGGGQLYSQMLPLADKLYITLIDAEIVGDTQFPEWLPEEWELVNRKNHSQDEKHNFAFEFITLVRHQQTS